MRPETIAGENGYDIPCLNNLKPGEHTAVIVSHGLGSSKWSPTFRKLSDTLPRYGIGTFSFDFPGHGDSPADGGMFRIENCLSDLAAAEAHVRKKLPGEIGRASCRERVFRAV
jgi:pimeloyl-ACP methyl ester carboxylesterase